jgi:hypothetical protein
MNGTLTLGACSATTSNVDGFIAVFDANAAGACRSITPLGATGSATVHDIAVDGDRLYVSGSFSGTMRDERGELLVSQGDSSAFVARMTVGVGGVSTIWLRTFGGTGLNVGRGIAPDDGGGAAWVLGTMGTAEVAGTQLPTGTSLVAIDFEGTVRYVRPMAGFSSTVSRVGSRLVFTGYQDSSPTLFGLEAPPPAGGDDVFAAFAVLP